MILFQIDAENIICATTGTNFNYLVEEDFCDNTFFVILKVFLSLCPIMISLILAVIYYKYKQEIRVWLYARNLCPGFFIEEDLDKQKKYDVFVSYSHKDAEFVEEQLVPILEGSYNYNLCLHYRDWIPGSFIAENICDSVANSKRTLIVLTPNFLESVWGKMEFRIAHTEAMKERRNRVILLLKEDIDTEKLDAELRSYISTNTYIKWGDSWFWKKLRYALPRSE